MFVAKIILATIYSLIFYYFHGSINELVFFIIGLIVSYVLLIVDQQYLVKFYQKNSFRHYYLTRSLLSYLVIIIFSIYTIASSQSSEGNGLLLGLATQLTLEMIAWHKPVKAFNRRFAWQIKKKFNQQEINLLVISSLIFIVFLSTAILF
jgi:hypothetical protein